MGQKMATVNAPKHKHFENEALPTVDGHLSHTRYLVMSVLYVSPRISSEIVTVADQEVPGHSRQ